MEIDVRSSIIVHSLNRLTKALGQRQGPIYDEESKSNVLATFDGTDRTKAIS